MADLQTQFMKFHDLIKIDYDGNKPLREKRDIILKTLEEGIKKKYPDGSVTFKHFNQGSYELGTGVEPLGADDYDIDVGIIFNIPQKDNNPLDIKKIVFEILNATYSRKVNIRKPCVRVQYHKAGEKAYHVDLAIYSRGTTWLWENLTDNLYIAKGKSDSEPSDIYWEISQPHQLKELMKSKFSSETDREQFRRVIRYLKRWKDYNSSLLGNGRPTGIALTACCYNYFKVEKDNVYSQIAKSNIAKYNDLRALQGMVNEMLNMYTSRSTRITIKLPVEPYNDLFAKMSDRQIQILKKQLEAFKSTLDNAANDSLPSKAAMRLRSEFGNFPIS